MTSKARRFASPHQDLIVAAKRGLLAIGECADQFEQAYQDFLRLHQECYGSSHIKPKHHWAMDLPQQWRQDRMVLDAFVIERGHLLIKSISEPVKNTTQFETSVLASATVVQLRAARELKLGDGLRGRTKRLEQYLVSNSLDVQGFTVTAADIVMKGRDVGAVVACATDASGLYLIVEPMDALGCVSPHACKFRRTDQLALWGALDVVLAHAWLDDPDGSVLVVSR